MPFPPSSLPTSDGLDSAIPLVLKIGGSVLRAAGDYRQAAARIAREALRQPTWVVVSAAHGVTDALNALAQSRNPQGAARILAQHARLLDGPLPASWSEDLTRAELGAGAGRPEALLGWGERASAFILQAWLRRVGVDAPVFELGPRRPLPRHRVAVVPGFYLRDRFGRTRTLPRGGSDVSALLLAVSWGASSVRLWKEGGGVRSPDRPDEIVPAIDATELLVWIGESVRPLHPAAVRIARRHGIELILEDPTGARPSTRVVSPRGLPPLPTPLARSAQR